MDRWHSHEVFNENAVHERAQPQMKRGQDATQGDLKLVRTGDALGEGLGKSCCERIRSVIPVWEIRGLKGNG
jgi:hypothetical protein